VIARNGEPGGRLEGTDLTAILQDLWGTKASGLLTLERDTVRKTILIRDGEILSASSTHPGERLGENLLRRGVITAAALEDAAGRSGHARRLGEILVEQGHLPAEELPGVLADQARQIVLSCFSWTSGRYHFRQERPPSTDVAQSGIGTVRTLREGILTIRDWSRIRAAIGDTLTAYRITSEGRDRCEELELTAADRRVLDRFSPRATVGEVCASLAMPDYEICQELWILRALGLIERTVLSPESARNAGVEQGQIDTAGLVRLLVRVGGEGETGILSVRDDDGEREAYLDGGRITFARSSITAHSLANVILRLGLADCWDLEDAECRQIQDSQIGRVLADRGRISYADLSLCQREQQEEILLSLFSMDEGIYRFERRVPPATPSTALDLPLEALILRGVRQVRDWLLVRNGVGGLFSRFVASSVPLCAESMSESVISTTIGELSQPRTASDLGRELSMPEFTVCQILWGLREIGAIVPVGEIARPVETESRQTAGSGPEPNRVGPEGPDQSEQDTRASDAPGDRTEEVLGSGTREEAPAASGSSGARSALAGQTAAALAPELFGPDRSQSAEPDNPAEEPHGPPDEARAGATHTHSAGPEIAAAIRAFNERHRVLYTAVRVEIGAGTQNFVVACRQRLSGGAASLFQGLEPGAAGEWDDAELARRIGEVGLPEGKRGLDRLLLTEMEQVRGILRASACDGLRRQLGLPPRRD
jgi:hypothetical protein